MALYKCFTYLLILLLNMYKILHTAKVEKVGWEAAVSRLTSNLRMWGPV